MKQTLAIMRKELSIYFGSPMALIFLGVFLAITLFVFFWIDTFFARNIADVRPLFRWMPLLLIFLVSALTMRQWSDEEQRGTLEILLTLPIRPWQLVIGKFLAVMVLIDLALALTLPLPITVSLLGNLDWGPVIGGYLAAILMASAYVAVGLFLSSRTDNQIVALILSTVLCGILYLIGTQNITEFVGDSVGNILRALATGSRFESIERGVIDLRDLMYYVSLALLFLALNILSLDSKRWSIGLHTQAYRHNATLGVSLLTLNLLVFNLWFYPLTGIRLDITEQDEYTLSTTTTDILSGLQEPLLIRGYFSERTHPLLSPLVPRIEDMLREYEVASGGQVTLEIVDPSQDPDLEAEANQTYGIRPTPFQVAGQYESALINAYFDVLIRYGDQSEVLNFRDLIEVESFGAGEIDVRLRNLEYDLTRTIKKVVFGFQSIDAVLAAQPEPAQLTLYITPDGLPPGFETVQETVANVASDIEAISSGNFGYEVINPDDPDSPVNRQTLLDTYSLQPFAKTLFSNETYYLHMILQVGDTAQLIYPSGDMTEVDVRTSIEAALKRTSSGFLKKIGLWIPVIGPDPTMAQLGQTQQPPFSTWNQLAEQLRQDYEVYNVDLSTGQVPADVDVLLVVAPQGMTDIDRYALDQYLMRGGAVIIAGSNYRVAPDPFSGSLALNPIEDGLKDMLDHYGINVEATMVLDPQNEPFPITVARNVQGFTLQELQALDYPYFVDVRPDGMAQDSPIIANLPAVTLNWVSPVRLDEEKKAAREVMTLLQSTEKSWLRDSTDIQPDPDTYPELGFPIEGPQESQPLAVSVRGNFESFFAGQPSPLNTEADDVSQAFQPPDSAAKTNTDFGTIETSPETARLVVIGSGDFVNDTVFQISAQLAFDRYLNSLQFVQNVVDWSVEDLDLLSIRSRGTYARVLIPLDRNEKSFWTWVNYIVILAALIIIGLVWATYRRNEAPMALSEQGRE